MGSSEDDEGRGESELIERKVKVSDFWMGKHELTWDEYELWMINLDKDNRIYNKHKSTKQDEHSDAVTKPTAPYTDMSFGMGKKGYPAICMTHLSARMYCMWLSARTGNFYRLPTEAEWEFACKAGTTTAYSFGDDPDKLSEHSWHMDNSRFQYQKVGQKKANPFGLHDMHGNVWEWVIDQFVSSPPPPSNKPSINPISLPKTLYPRTVKGGSWDDDEKSHRSASRKLCAPSMRFRCCDEGVAMHLSPGYRSVYEEHTPDACPLPHRHRKEYCVGRLLLSNDVHALARIQA